jgi:uracil-DNA glycosylase
MPKPLDPQTKEHLAARVKYYKEMGIHDFYHQPIDPNVELALQREDVYIANVVKCRPPSNRTPEKDECDVCSPFLMRQIDVIKPKVIVALGAVAAKNLLAVNDSMANLRGRWYDFRNSKLLVTYHPAYLLRDPRQKKEAWKDLQMAMKFLGLTPPAAKSSPE